MRLIGFIFLLLVAVALIGRCGRDQPSTKQAGVEPPVACRAGEPANSVVAVRERHELHTEPRAGSARILNEHATRILGRTEYQLVDNSTTVRRLCRTAEWSEVQIVEPSWLSSHRGWVPNRILRPISSDAMGARLYEEADFYWENETRPHRRQIVAAVNRIVREQPGCSGIDPGTIARSPSRSRPGRPVFFITCGEGPGVFNVWFEPDGTVLR